METKALSQFDKEPEYDDELRKSIDPAKIPEQIETPETVLFVFANNPNTLQFELIEQASLGRRTEGGEQPDIDLAPYGGFPAGISRMHARLHRSEDGVMIEDLGSRNGTHVGGDRLKQGDYVLIPNGQALRLGGLQCWIFYKAV